MSYNSTKMLLGWASEDDQTQRTRKEVYGDTHRGMLGPKCSL